MRRQFAARVGLDNRSRILSLAEAWDMTLSEATRAVAILGLGGTWDDVEDATAKARLGTTRLAETLSDVGERMAEPGHGQKGPFVQDERLVTARMPKRWAELLVHERGAFKQAVLAGLMRVA